MLQSSLSGPVLDVSDLRVTFDTERGAAVAVDGVSLQIARGQTVALVGESGSGKSVMSLAIMRLLAKSAKVAGDRLVLRDREGLPRDLLGLSDKEMPEVRGDLAAMIFQEPMTSLNPVHTVGDQIAEAVRLHRKVSKRQALQRAEDMLRQVGIPEPASRLAAYPHELSGGMRQRVMIAMALACEPGLLIADEPTTALDVTIQAQILDLLRSLRESNGQAMLFITHDLGVVAEVADRVYVMYCGQVVESGEVSDIMSTPRHPYTKGLMASLPRIDRPQAPGTHFHSVPGRVSDPWNRPPGCRFAPRCEFARPGLCDVAVPALEHVASDHAVRCVRHQEIHGVACV